MSPQPRHLPDREAGHEVVLEPADMRPSDKRRLREHVQSLLEALLLDERRHATFEVGDRDAGATKRDEEGLELYLGDGPLEDPRQGPGQ